MVGVDDRDLQLTVTMIREHHAAIVQARETGTAVPWQRMWHQTAPNVPYQTEWGMMGHILESAPLPTYVALAIEGVPDMLADIEAFQADPNSQYAGGPQPCWVCHELAFDENVNWDGPVGTRRFFDSWGVPLTFGGAPANPPPWGRNTGIGRNRRIHGR